MIVFQFEIIEGILTESKSFDHLPSFDILLSGNEKVIQKAKLLGFKYLNVSVNPRLNIF